MLKMSFAVVVGLALPASADPVRIKDTFAFDVMTPNKQCARVTGALQKKLEKSYTCTATAADDPGSASGKPIAARCDTKGKKPSTFLLFATKADCNEERETQLANGD